MADPHVTDIQQRYRDLDAMHHVNNAVYATYLEEARRRYFRDVLDEELARVSSALARVEVEFERALEPGADVTVATWITRLGESSLTWEHEIRDGGVVAATAAAVHVNLDPETGRSAPLPPEWRDRIDVGSPPETDRTG